MEVPHTETRVLETTSHRLTERLRLQMEARIFYLAGNPEKIDQRLEELDEEWDMERILQANAAGVSLFGVLMASHNRKWLLLPLTVAGFLMQHAVQGWCPPVEIFRRIGIRTTKEINDERYALKTLRGDFKETNIADNLDPAEKAQKALEAIEKHTQG